MKTRGGYLDSLTAMGMLMMQPMGVFLVIAGVSVCLSIALVILKLEGKWSAKATGRVYDASCEKRQDGGVNCDVAFEFDVDGRSYSNKVRAGVIYRNGDIVDLKYDPADPNNAQIVLIDWARLAWMLIFLCGCWMLAHIGYLSPTTGSS